jgi:hypothetical protein
MQGGARAYFVNDDAFDAPSFPDFTVIADGDDEDL